MSDGAASLLLAPLEATSSFLRGSALGPEAVAAELRLIEPFDPDIGAGLDVLGPLDHVRISERPDGDLEEAIETLRLEASRQLAAGHFPMTLGGEHTVTLGPLAAVQERHGEVGLVQLDAHADLRESYEGRAISHACVIRRAHEDLTIPVVGLGIRSMSEGEADYAAEADRLVHLPPSRLGSRGVLERALATLPERVYLTVDMDVFDPSVAPGVGTPEAGGLHWDEVADLVDAVALHKKIVGADVVELAPSVERERTARLAARLVIRVLLRSLGGGHHRRRSPSVSPGATAS